MPHEPKIDSEAISLMNALLARRDIAITAAEAFKRAYPDAPSEMINAAVHHVISEGVGAIVDWLAAIEKFIRDPSHEPDYGAVWHLLYHLYNWQQFQALMPLGRHALQDHLNDVQYLLNEGDHNAALEAVKQLSKRLTGSVDPPRLIE